MTITNNLYYRVQINKYVLVIMFGSKSHNHAISTIAYADVIRENN